MVLFYSKFTGGPVPFELVLVSHFCDTYFHVMWVGYTKDSIPKSLIDNTRILYTSAMQGEGGKSYYGKSHNF